jgi:hypothetical protein
MLAFDGRESAMFLHMALSMFNGDANRSWSSGWDRFKCLAEGARARRTETS